VNERPLQRGAVVLKVLGHGKDRRAKREGRPKGEKLGEGSGSQKKDLKDGVRVMVGISGLPLRERQDVRGHKTRSDKAEDADYEPFRGGTDAL